MDGKIVIKTELDTISFKKQIEKLESDLEKLNYEYNALKKGGDFEGKTEELKKYRAEAERVRNKLSQLREKQAEIDNQGLNNMKDSLSNIGNGMESIIKKVTRWGLAVFGVRSAYMFIRQSMSTLSQYDEQMAVNIEYIRYMLASVLKPVIETLINLAYKLLAYVNYISQAWFGINLFANASVSAFKKQNSAIKSTNKSAKELQKTLAGFDEMNILQDNGSTKVGGGGGGISTPSFPSMENVEIPAWVKWIADNKELIIGGIIGIGLAMLTLKGHVATLMGSAAAGTGLLGLKTLLLGLAAVYTITLAVKGTKQLIKDVKETKEALKNSKEVAEGFNNQTKDNIKQMYEQAKASNFSKDTMERLNYMLKSTSDNTYGLAQNTKDQITFIGRFNGMNKEATDKLKLFNDRLTNVNNTYKDLYEQGLLNEQQTNDYAESISNQIQVMEQLGKNADDLKLKYEKLTGHKYELKVTAKVEDNVSKTIKDLVEKGVKIYYTTGGGGKGGFGGGTSGGRAKGGIFYPSLLPKLAAGGIINRPGPGVPYNGAVIGEKGAEAVVPLTDSQQMSLLGKAIADNIVINANIVNTMNGRVISRELQRVQNENDFAFNR